MGSGSKSATTSSRHRRYNPGEEFLYRFEANRTFSRDGKRPVSSPARIINLSGKKRNKFDPLEDTAMAQSPSPNLIQESFGSSLMMLQQGYRKINPGKFLQLKKISDRPNPVPVTSPRSGEPTPRLVKHMAHAAGENNILRSKSAKQVSKVTHYDYRARTANIPSSAYKNPSNVADVVVPYIKQAHRKYQSQTNLSLRPERDHQPFETFSDRCIRCSEFPDIQIEGRSLSRILTNSNMLMAKGHCEILGPDSCPDCVKTRSQKNNVEQCRRNTPSFDNDVYKLVLVHEKAPYLSIREVQRKILDGEISDKVLNVSRWPQIDNVAIINEDTIGFAEDKDTQVSFPEISNSVSNSRKSKGALKSSKSFILSNVSLFPTIHENSEISDGSDSEEQEEQEEEKEDEEHEQEQEEQEEEKEDKEQKQEQETVKEQEDEKHLKTQAGTLTDAKVVFRKKSAEKMRKIQLFPASEKSTAPSTSLNVKCDEEIFHINNYEKKFNKTFGTLVAKVDSLENNVSTSKVSGVRHMTVSAYKRSRQRCFTCNVIPSQDFFFDISDLNNRLRNAQTTSSSSSEQIHQQFIPNNLPEDVSKNTKLLSSELSVAESKVETSSIASSDSSLPSTKFNMAYEPPILFGNIGNNTHNSQHSSIV